MYPAVMVETLGNMDNDEDEDEDENGGCLKVELKIQD
jgi:hypothetical protein